MSQIEKNTVPAKNQLKENDYITYENNGGKKIMFVGNSMTLHGVKEDIGWFWNFGMAASSIDKDYVHILIKKTDEKINASYCICQASEWEQNYKHGKTILHKFENARDFEPDIIIMRIVENCPFDDYDKDTFYSEYGKLIRYLDKGNKAKVIITTGFWHHKAADPDIIRFAKDNCYPLVLLGEIGDDDSMKALGKFEHPGVSMHPGDKGMQAIANAIWVELEKLL